METDNKARNIPYQYFRHIFFIVWFPFSELIVVDTFIFVVLVQPQNDDDEMNQSFPDPTAP
jgi:hypothetical protein